MSSPSFVKYLLCIERELLQELRVGQGEETLAVDVVSDHGDLFYAVGQIPEVTPIGELHSQTSLTNFVHIALHVIQSEGIVKILDLLDEVDRDVVLIHCCFLLVFPFRCTYYSILLACCQHFFMLSNC